MIQYRLLEIASFYHKYLECFYNMNPELPNLDYNSHKRFLLSDCFAECDFIHPEFTKLGVESDIIIYNDEKLQRKWNEKYKNCSLFEIACAQIKSFKPDVLYISDMGIFDVDQLKQLKELTNYKCKFVGWHFTTVSDGFFKISNYYDQVYTGSKYILSLIKANYSNVKLLYHGFETSLLKKLPSTERVNKLVFPGSIFLGEEIHNNRIDMFGQLYKKNIPCDFYGEVYGSFVPHNLKQCAKWILSKNKPSKDRIQTEKIIKRNLHPSVFGIEYYQVLNQYSVCINQHAVIAGTGAGNMRMFEATGMGACLLTDYRDENTDLFIPDEEIVVYHNYSELIEKAEYLINNPNVATEIAKKGQLRTLNTHSYKQKAKKMNEYIQELL